MSASTVKFNKQDRPDFFPELRKRVNSYFKENNISKHANFNMKFKTVFMLCLYFAPLVLMVTGVVSSLWLVMLMWVIMALGMAGVGLGITHDANHRAYSKSEKVNNALGALLNCIGAYHINWKIQHNSLHHSFTNVHGFDEDINTGVLRCSPTQEMKGYYRFQAFYAPFLYGLMTIYWIISRDFKQLAKYNRLNMLSKHGLTMGQAITRLIFNKVLYLGITLVLPLVFVQLPWWQIVLGFLLMQFICGLILALIFQSAHILEETSFFEVDEKGSVENNWAIHQMKTTANFANGSVWFSWFIGGLNYQIEHHLFPNICHVHYRNISKIVQKTAKEFNVPYYQHRTFLGALRSHFSMLNQLGTGSYDRRLAKA